MVGDVQGADPLLLAGEDALLWFWGCGVSAFGD